MRLYDDESEDTPPQINIVPMIDVIFAILTFFIMSTLYLNRSQSLPVNLPQASTSQSQLQPTSVTVTIDQQGNLALNRQPIQLEALEGQVRTLVGDKEQVVVVLNADRQVSHGQVVAVMDRLRRIQGVKLAIATTQP